MRKKRRAAAAAAVLVLLLTGGCQKKYEQIDLNGESLQESVQGDLQEDTDMEDGGEPALSVSGGEEGTGQDDELLAETVKFRKGGVSYAAEVKAGGKAAP